MDDIVKIWGRERVIANHGLYCGKILFVEPGYQSSLHYHRIKDETFYVDSGEVSLEIFLDTARPREKHVLRLKKGQSIRIEPLTPHRFRSATSDPAKIIEVSTYHDDDDVVRIEDSRSL